MILIGIIFIDINNIFAWIGNPNPCLRVQSPDRQYKYIAYYTKPNNIRQRLKLLNKYPKCLTRVTTHINFTSNITYPTSKTPYINSKGINIDK